MNPYGIPLGGIWRFLSWLPNWFLLRSFPDEVMEGLIDFEIQPRHESISINLGQVATANIWLVATNRSPFDLELDRAELFLSCGGVALPLNILKRTKIAASKKIEFHISTPIPDGHANAIAHSIENHHTHISGTLIFNSKIRNFNLPLKNLSGIKPNFLNVHVRQQKIQ